ncbi:carbamoyltransferase [Sporomusaceae bacterium FL31]|nr:carbamoyltransferase [Sporomusaceae bacterium FL31]GCE33209.1 carbamoyltransferase [Sporomusaceae bacterium]
MMERLRLCVTGIVQGVGFRPFVYHLAHKFDLAGWVLNHANGVQIEVEGKPEMLSRFLNALRAEAPPQASIAGVTTEPVAIEGETRFDIKKSVAMSSRSVLVSPDIATCSDCQREIKQAWNRRLFYPFINCTNCGPRYSIIKELPYDRSSTTMSEFTMCSHCQSEYRNPADRRFHAQPNACPACGPSYQLITKSGELVTGDPVAMARQFITNGAILAIKGIGGYHLVCNAEDNQAVTLLRQRKFREDKPFAVMCSDLSTVRRHCNVSKEEERLLAGAVKPIVLLEKGCCYDLAQAIAPGNPYLGVMLPYAPIHWILMESEDIWVMTSGNGCDEPIAYQDDDARNRLAGIADYFLIHNRPIYTRIDDSVARVIRNKPTILRRSRGYAPAPIALSGEGPQVLACGGELKNTFCFTKQKSAFLSPHIGDLENLATLECYAGTIEHYTRLFDTKPEFVVHDMHPDYLSTKYAQMLELPKIAVQHHHAHIASVLAEHGVNESVIGVAFDGTGYGEDGHLWGSEFMVADCSSFTRAAHSRYLTLPGGAKAIQEPWRQAAWMLHELFGNDFIRMDIPLNRNIPENWQLMVEAANKGINSPLACGAGRLFDIAAGILGLRPSIRYEGQAAVDLELAASGARGWLLPYSISEGQVAELDFRPTFAGMAEALQHKVNPGELAASFHLTLATATLEMIERIYQTTGIRKVALSGGVFQNMTLLSHILGMANDRFTVLLNHQVPTNDGGLALGQAAIARERSK